MPCGRQSIRSQSFSCAQPKSRLRAFNSASLRQCKANKIFPCHDVHEKLYL